jgi:hypothetical protein
MTYPNRASAFQNALKQKKDRKETAARKKETEQEIASVRCHLDLADDYLLVLPDDSCDHQHQDDTSNGGSEGMLLSSQQGKVTLAQLLDHSDPFDGNLEVDDGEDSYVSCLLEEESEADMPMDLENTYLPSPNNTTAPGPGVPSSVETTRSKFSLEEICTYELITLLDNAGAPRNCYSKMLTLLRKQYKKGFKVKDAISRDVFLRKMQENFNCPTLLTSVVSDCNVFRFSFTEMLQDLVDSQQNHIHLFNGSIEPGDELWNTSWMHTTFDQYGPDFDNENEIMLPIILYMDKTGTDAYQRYSLEPVLFSLGVLSREKREDRRSWRHLGFIPSTDHMEDKDLTLQFYHNCLSVLLQDLKYAQANPPTIQVVKDGQRVAMKARLPLMLILGDQLSQDTLTARCKSNSGGAGRVHRACMCSYLTVDNPSHRCVKVCADTLREMTLLATMSDVDLRKIIDDDGCILNKDSAKKRNSKEMKYLRKRRKMFTRILNRPYTSHAVKNAFDDIDFGSWSGGVYDATYDDFMHATESGLLTYIGSAIFGGLQPKECESLELKIRPLLTATRSSVRSHYPRWRVQKGFTRQTLMTASERVGSLFILTLALQVSSIREVVRIGHERQSQKYLAFPPKKKNPPATSKTQFVKKANKNIVLDDCSVSTTDDDSSVDHQKGVVGRKQDYPFYYEGYFHTMNIKTIMHTLEHLHRHGFNLKQLKSLDFLQINQLMSTCYQLFSQTNNVTSYPLRSIAGCYSALGPDVNFIPTDITELVKKAMSSDSYVLNHGRSHGIPNVIQKHYREKPKIKGDGSTSAVLCDVNSLVLFLEYVLCYHSFCKYSSSLPPVLRDSFEVVDYGGRNVIRYFEKMIYRGDNSLDARTTKVHAQLRTGQNHRDLGSTQHSSCDTGERLLKTEAKGISRTAQQRGRQTFEKQTCLRIVDRSVMDNVGMCVERQEASSSELELQEVQQEIKGDRFSRQRPNFKLSRVGKKVQASDRFGKLRSPDKTSGYLQDHIVDFLLNEDLNLHYFEVYCEAIIRNDSYIRAWPNYRNTGSWYDFVNVQWVSGLMFPARVICFYNKIEADGTRKPYALVHGVDEKTKGKVQSSVDSLLTTHFRMAYITRRNSRAKPVPLIQSVPVASIDSAVMGYHKQPSKILFDCTCREVMIVRPRSEWAYLWLAWNEELQKANKRETTDFRRKKVYVSLGNKSLISNVRLNVEQKLEIPIDLE